MGCLVFAATMVAYCTLEAGDAAPFAPSGMPWTEGGACDMRSHPAVTMPFSCCPLNYSPKTRKRDGSCWVAWSQKGNGAALGR